MRTYAYIDASNLFYGGKKSLGWSVDFEKLYKYIHSRFDVSQIYYFGGVEIHKFIFDYQTKETVCLSDLEKYFIRCIEKSRIDNAYTECVLLESYLKKVYFYQKLEKFGFKLVLKPVKIYEDENGNQKRKANCDVEMVLHLMCDKAFFDRVVILSGDGDFLPVLKYLRDIDKKEVVILARGKRTAKEIKRFAGDKFMDFTHNLRNRLERLDM